VDRIPEGAGFLQVSLLPLPPIIPHMICHFSALNMEAVIFIFTAMGTSSLAGSLFFNDTALILLGMKIQMRWGDYYLL
jgi:hypothetical protein